MNMDEAIQKAFPLLAVPASGNLPPAQNSGMRYLVANTGIWREINLPWVRVCHPVAQTPFALPYGPLEDAVEFRCGAIPQSVIREFIRDAKAASPLEVAGVFLWNEVTGDWRYQGRYAQSVSGAHIDYDEVSPREGEHIVVDVHSHGQHGAFFSSQDDKDDAGAMKVSLVLGNLEQEVPSSQMRLCMAGQIFEPAYLNGHGQLGVCA